MTTDKEAERIAAGLTEAQHHWVTHRENYDSFWCPDRRTTKAIGRKGLIRAGAHRSVFDWTPLGLRVRTILQGETQ